MTKQKKIPQLRFPEFSKPWIESKMGEVYSFKITNSFSREDLNYQSGQVKNIHYGDIHTKFKTLFDITNEKVPFINTTISIDRISEDNYCQEGDMIFADASEDLNDVGKSVEIYNLNNERLLSGLHTILARPAMGIFSRGFGGYLFKSNFIRTQIQKESQGSKVLSISATRLSGISLIYPTISEQIKIASFLRSVDDKLDALKRKKTLLERYKKAVMQEIFSQKLRFKKDNRKFPDWQVKKLGEVAEVFDGTHQTPTYVESGVPFYSVEQVTANDFSKTKFISEEVFEKENQRVKIERGDILMTRIGDIGTARYIDWDVRASFYVSLALIKQSSKYDSEFLAHYITTSQFQNELWKRTIHVAFPQKINLGEISNCLVFLPTKEEQRKIANFLTSLDSNILSVFSQIQKTLQYKNGLYQKMFCLV